MPQASKQSAAPSKADKLCVESDHRQTIIAGFDLLGHYAEQYAKQKGLKIYSEQDLIARLLHLSIEVGELAEAVRCGDGNSSDLPGFSNAEEELADIAILVTILAQARQWRIGEAAVAKLEHCSVYRPWMHGKKW